MKFLLDMNKIERLKLIEQYRKGRLEGIALERFQQLLDSSELLQKELALDKEMSEALNPGSDYNLFHTLVKEAEHNYFSKDLSTRKTYWKVAAAVLFVSVSSFILWFVSQENTPDEIFNSAFEAYQAPTNFRGDQLSGMDEEFMLGLIKYGDQNYNESIKLFSDAVEKDSLNHTAKFLLGISYLAQKDFVMAESILKSMVNDSSHLFQDQVRWYLGLLYLSDTDESNDAEAKPLFNQIESQNLTEEVRKLRLK